MGDGTDGRMTITQAARIVGVCSRTLARWEQTGKVPRSRRDWRGWRVYYRRDVQRLLRFRRQLRD